MAMTRLTVILSMLFLSGCTNDNYSILSAASNACDFQFSGEHVEVSRKRNFIEEISIQGGTYSENGVLLVSDSEFKLLGLALDGSSSYRKMDGSESKVYENSSTKINQCFGMCELSKSEPKVTYSVECS